MLSGKGEIEESIDLTACFCFTLTFLVNGRVVSADDGTVKNMQRNPLINNITPAVNVWKGLT